MKRIVIIEDDQVMRSELAELLRGAGYDSFTLDYISTQNILALNPDLVLLDIHLPNQNGEQLLKELRATSETPVIMVTSSASEADELISMSYGADDYILKPYNPHILLLRISAVLKRSYHAPASRQFRQLRIDLDRGVIEDGNSRILLTKNEMIVLRHLLDSDGKIVTRDALMTDLWNNHEYINDNALTVTISRLRAKLKSLGADNAIDTRKGLGYVLQ